MVILFLTGNRHKNVLKSYLSFFNLSSSLFFISSNFAKTAVYSSCILFISALERKFFKPIGLRCEANHIKVIIIPTSTWLGSFYLEESLGKKIRIFVSLQPVGEKFEISNFFLKNMNMRNFPGQWGI